MTITEKTISSKRIYEGKIINLRIDTIELPEQKYSKREIVEHNGGSAVIPVTEDNKIILVKQFRKAAEEYLIEIPAGKIDPSEDPKDCVIRELVEETGINAGKIEFLFKCYSTPGFSNEVLHIYAAYDLEFGAPAPDEDEYIEILKLDIDEAIKMIYDGEIKDCKTISAILAIRLKLS
ncbi:NUDIX hydrolase [Clostridiaceae bacterium M8S5]|nr:NUDIX hydrolase [Clostridiaceae bacterium M8S5]